MQARTPTHAAELAKQVARRNQLATHLADLFSSEKEITLEAGCGHGHWLTAFGDAHRDTVCLGIDIIAERIEKAQSKCRRAGLENIHFVKAELTETLACLPASVRLQQIIFLFPDPWPKKRHFRRRMIQPDLLTQLGERATSGARLYFRTDSEDYFQWTRELLQHHPAWQLSSDPSSWIFEQETVFQRKMDQYQSLIAVRIERSGDL